MNYFWLKVGFSQLGNSGCNYFCRFLSSWGFWGRINFAAFAQLEVLGRITFANFWDIFGKIYVGASSNSNPKR